MRIDHRRATADFRWHIGHDGNLPGTLIHHARCVFCSKSASAHAGAVIEAAVLCRPIASLGFFDLLLASLYRAIFGAVLVSPVALSTEVEDRLAPSTDDLAEAQDSRLLLAGKLDHSRLSQHPPVREIQKMAKKKKKTKAERERRRAERERIDLDVLAGETARSGIAAWRATSEAG